MVTPENKSDAKPTMTSEAQLRNIFENIVDGVLVVDPKSRCFRIANRAVCRMVGYSESEMLTLCVNDIHPAESLPFVLDRFRELSEGRVPSVLDIPVKRKDGSVFFADINASAVQFEDAVYTVGIFRDASIRRKVEADLLRKTEELDRYFESSLDLLCIADMDGYFKRVNREWEKVLGYPVTDLVGTKFLDLVHPDDMTSTLSAIAQLSSQIEVRNFVNRYRHRDGTWRWMEWRSLQSGHDIYATARDITDRKQAEASILESARMFEAVFNASPIAIAIASLKDGKFINVNTAVCKMFGWSREELLTMTPRQAQLWEDPLDREKMLVEFESVGHISNREAQLRCKDGSLIYASISLWPLVLDGHPHLMYVGEDITARKRGEENLLKTQKLESLGMLAGGIAHDFNNLLAGIFGNIDLAQGELESGNREDAALFLARSMGVMERARDLTRQLLTFSKGGAPLKQQGNLGQTVRETVLFALSGAGVKANIEVLEGVWECEYDVHQMGQVLENIVINAKESMPGGGEIRVGVENKFIAQNSPTGLCAGRYVCISVKDSGVGISPQYLSKIFDPFFSTKQTGSGLGLATSWSIVQRHGGHIDVESEPGKGTTFILYIPAGAGPAASCESSAAPVVLKASGRILVMDDEAYIRDIATRMLSTVGYTVESVCGGREAVEKYQQAMTEGRPFDAVLLDLTIPGGMGGRETLSLLSALDPSVRAVASSGYADDPIMAAPTSFGFVASLEKPYRKGWVAALFERLLRPVSDN